MKTVADFRAEKEKYTRIDHFFAESVEEIYQKLPYDAFLLSVTIDPMDISRYIVSHYI